MIWTLFKAEIIEALVYLDTIKIFMKPIQIKGLLLELQRLVNQERIHQLSVTFQVM